MASLSLLSASNPTFPAIHRETLNQSATLPADPHGCVRGSKKSRLIQSFPSQKVHLNF